VAQHTPSSSSIRFACYFADLSNLVYCFCFLPNKVSISTKAAKHTSVQKFEVRVCGGNRSGKINRNKKDGRRKMKRSLGIWKRPYAGVNHLVLCPPPFFMLVWNLRSTSFAPPPNI
jgi:hypothetical protein